MSSLIHVGGGPPFVPGAPDVVSTWFTQRELFSRELEIGTANLLARAYDKVYLLTYEDRRSLKKYVGEVAGNVHILFSPSGMPNVFYRLVAPVIFRQYFKDVCVCRTNQLRGSMTALVSKFLFGTKIILRQGYQISKFVQETLHRGSPRPFRAHVFYVLAVLLELIAYNTADLIVVSSNADKDYVMRRYRIDGGRVCVVPNWVDIDLFKPLPGISKERGRIVFVGKLAVQKNTFSLINAVRRLPGVRLYLIGDGPLRKPLEQKLRNERIDNVVLLGTVHHRDIPYELNRSEVFILPSLYEGSPKALLEAMACGLPVIGTNVTGIKEVVADGENGLLCNTDSESIRDAIIRLLASSDLRRRLGSNARAQIESNYSMERILEREIAVHSTVL